MFKYVLHCENQNKHVNIKCQYNKLNLQWHIIEFVECNKEKHALKPWCDFSSCVPWVTISPWAWWCTSSNTQNTMRSTAISMTVMTIYLSKDSIWPAIARLSLTVRYREPEGDMRGRVIIRVSLCLSQMCVSLWTWWSWTLQLNIFGTGCSRSVVLNLFRTD